MHGYKGTDYGEAEGRSLRILEACCRFQTLRLHLCSTTKILVEDEDQF